MSVKGIIDLKIPENQIGFTGVQPEFNPFHFRMAFKVCPDSVTKYRTAVISVNNPKPVYRCICTTKPGFNSRDCLHFCHIVNIDFLKCADHNAYLPFLGSAAL